MDRMSLSSARECQSPGCRSTRSLSESAQILEQLLPGLRHLGSVERGGDKPYHVLINGENHHALEALR